MTEDSCHCKFARKSLLFANILVDLCNKNQLDAPYILSLFSLSTSACFWHICSLSSGGILYIYSNWYVLCFSVDWLLAELWWNSI